MGTKPTTPSTQHNKLWLTKIISDAASALEEINLTVQTLPKTASNVDANWWGVMSCLVIHCIFIYCILPQLKDTSDSVIKSQIIYTRIPSTN